MTLNRRPVASLWIGEKLHYINQLCLKSHLLHGHPVTLYCTDKVTNAPEGVVIRPATEIMEIDMALVEATSASFLSNVFRYKMIRKTGALWIDCDAFCHKPFPDEWDYVFAGHGMRGALNCGVVGLPVQCHLMDMLLDYYDNLPEAPAWFNKQQRKRLDKQDSALPQAVIWMLLTSRSSASESPSLSSTGSPSFSRGRTVSRTALGCSKISLIMKCS